MNCGEESVSLSVEVEAVKDGSRDARGIDDIDVPLRCAKALGKAGLDIILENRQLVPCAEIRNSLLGARKIDQDDVGVSEFFTVFIDDFLQLRSLRMTVWSGGLREVDNKDGPQKFVAVAFGVVGCRVWVHIGQTEIGDGGRMDTAIFGCVTGFSVCCRHAHHCQQENPSHGFFIERSDATGDSFVCHGIVAWNQSG